MYSMFCYVYSWRFDPTLVFSSVPSAPPVDGAEHPPAVNAPPAPDGNGGEDKMEGKRG